MKKFLIFPLVFALFWLCFFLDSTWQRQESEPFFCENGRVKVLSTTPMIGDLVCEIGGDCIDHVHLIQRDLDPHSYELVKGDDEKLENADLIFCNGLGLEHGASLCHYLQEGEKVIALGDRIFALDPASILFVDGGQIDPHIWMDLRLFSLAIDPIVASLSRKEPEFAPHFLRRGEELKQKMLRVDRSLYERIQSLPSPHRYLVTSHNAFNYFTRRYLADPQEEEWANRSMAPEGLAPDGQMSVLDVQKVVDFLLHYQVQVVFPESNVNRDCLKKVVSICREKGLRVSIADTPLYGDTMGEKGSGAETYLQMIEHNISTLITCLSTYHEERAKCH